MFKTKQQFYIYDSIDVNDLTDGIISSIEILLPVFNLSDPITTTHNGIGFMAEIPEGIKFVSINNLKVVGGWMLRQEYDIQGMLKRIESNGLNSDQTELVYERIIEKFLDEEVTFSLEDSFYIYGALARLNRDLRRIKSDSRGNDNA